MKIITKEIKYKQRHNIKTSYQVKERFDDFFMPPHKENRWAEKFLYGAEINFDLGTSSKVNMILHGDGSSNIFVKDGLLPFRFYSKHKIASVLQINEPDELYGGREVNEEFDFVVSNPPFSVNLDTETKRYLNNSFLFGDKKNSENLFIERWYQLLKEKGRLGVVLPESVFDTTENKYIRILIYTYFKVKAVVSLPQLTFEPYTSTKTSLLFAQKKTKKEIKEWKDKWKAYGNEWAKLNTRVNNYVRVFIDEEDLEKFPSIKNHKESEISKNILRFLKDYITPEDKNLSSKELLEKYSEEITEISKIDNDLKDIFGYYNSSWIFGEISRDFNYDIFMATAENVGYKRTKRGEKLMPNDLYDIEIAPTFIDKTKLKREYEEKINYFLNLKKELEKELTELKIKTKEKFNKNQKKKKHRLEKDILDCDYEAERLTTEKNEVEKIINTYYEKKGKYWRIKDTYYDRTDENLLAHFNIGFLKNLRSEDVLIHRNVEITILDGMRNETLWD